MLWVLDTGDWDILSFKLAVEGCMLAEKCMCYEIGYLIGLFLRR